MDAQTMSDLFQPAITDALNDTLANNGGGVTIAYIAMVQYMDTEGNNCWSFVSGADQSMALSLGMLQIADSMATDQMMKAYKLGGLDDDDSD